MFKLPSTIAKAFFSQIPRWIILVLIFLIGFSSFLISKLEIFENEIINLFFELFGAFVSIAVSLEFLRESFYSQIHLKEFTDQVERLFDKKIDAQLIQAREYGLELIEKALPIEKLFDELQPNDTLWWLDTFCPGEIRWINHFKEAIERGVTVNMLIMDPKSHLCAMRAKELESCFTLESFIEQLRGFIKEFQRHQRNFEDKGYSEKFNIVLYDDLLGVPCYIVERNKQPIYAYSSMYLTEPTGLGFPHFRWKEGYMCNTLFSYVKRKYDRYK